MVRYDNIPLPAAAAKLVGEALLAISNAEPCAPPQQLCVKCHGVMPNRSLFKYCGACVVKLRDGNL